MNIMEEYNVLIETQEEQLFLFPIKAESYKHANALVMRESARHDFLEGVEISTVGVFGKGSPVNLLEDTYGD